MAGPTQSPSNTVSQAARIVPQRGVRVQSNAMFCADGLVKWQTATCSPHDLSCNDGKGYHVLLHKIDVLNTYSFRLVLRVDPFIVLLTILASKKKLSIQWF